MTKLTLSMDEEIVAKAKELAKARGTSVSGMFTNLVRSLAAGRSRGIKLGPVTRRALSLVKSPPKGEYRELLTDALMEKYGIKK